MRDYRKQRVKATQSPSPSVITVNVNGLTSPVKTHQLADGKRNKIPLYAAHETLPQDTRMDTG